VILTRALFIVKKQQSGPCGYKSLRTIVVQSIAKLVFAFIGITCPAAPSVSYTKIGLKLAGVKKKRLELRTC